MYSFTEENYLKAIYKLQEQTGDSIPTNAIAQVLQTRAASVTDMIQKLSLKKLLRYEKYRGVSLTEKGRKVAVDTVRKHRLWETFLCEKLRFTWDQVHDIAEQLEHIQSAELIDRLDEFLDFPTHDPHGDPIPASGGEVRASNFILLTQLQPGDKAVLSGVVNHSPVFLRYLEQINLTLGKVFTVKEVLEFDRSMILHMHGKGQVQLSHDVIRNLLVKLSHGRTTE